MASILISGQNDCHIHDRQYRFSGFVCKKVENSRIFFYVAKNMIDFANIFALALSFRDESQTIPDEIFTDLGETDP